MQAGPVPLSYIPGPFEGLLLRGIAVDLVNLLLLPTLHTHTHTHTRMYLPTRVFIF
jgi:hypothetical protein